ncbi:Metallo-dependent phosphatase-like protein [Choanephora cucurbitarum]|nr:Metallo-dependent phosphatase-like protein [Choanephora cucurbitarum]
MTDDKSYQRHPLIMFFTKFYSSLYMKRNYSHLMYQIQPKDVIIMGDLSDNGREWKDDAFYAKEVNRFHTIFPTSDKIHYMAGNHDIGFDQGVNRTKVEQFKQYFGPTSYTFEHHGYQFVIMDTISLSSSDPVLSDRSILDQIPSHPRRLLFTHVPLFRTEDQHCGPNRQQSRLNWIVNQRGYQYQNLVSKELSELILDKIKPLAVFSGDDHDYCKVVHRDHIPEITVPTFSMSQGVQFPGLVVLEMNPQHLSTHLCWLPNQITIFVQYGLLALFTLLCLLVYHHSRAVSLKTYRFNLSKEELGMHDTFTHNSFGFLKQFLMSVKEVAIISLIAYICCILLF